MNEIMEIDDIQKLDLLIAQREVALAYIDDNPELTEIGLERAEFLLTAINEKIAEIDSSQVVNRASESSTKEEAAKLEKDLQKAYADLDDDALF